MLITEHRIFSLCSDTLGNHVQVGKMRVKANWALFSSFCAQIQPSPTIYALASHMWKGTNYRSPLFHLVCLLGNAEIQSENWVWRSTESLMCISRATVTMWTEILTSYCVRAGINNCKIFIVNRYFTMYTLDRSDE